MTGHQDLFQEAMDQGHSAAWDQLWDRAAHFYRRALEAFPDQPQALTSLGLALFELQEFEEALRAYQKASSLLPQDPIPVEKVAQLYERLGRQEKAAQAALQAAELHLKNHEVNKAIENWTRVTQLDPGNLRAQARLALVYERIGEKNKAVKAYLAVAGLLQSAGEKEKALRAVNQALELEPRNSEALEAFTLLRASRPLPKPGRQAKLAWEPGAATSLRSSPARQVEAQPTAQSGDGADPVADPVAQASQRALRALAGLLFEGVDETQAERLVRRDLGAFIRGSKTEKQVDRARLLHLVGQVVDLQTQGQPDQAAKELEKAIEAGLDHTAALFDLGLLYANSGRPEDALQPLQATTKHDDFALGSHLLLGDCLRQLDRLPEAAIEYLQALKLADVQVVNPEQADDLRQLYEPIIEAYRQQAGPANQAQLCDNVRDLLMRPDWPARLALARRQLPTRFGGEPSVPLAEILTEARCSQVLESIRRIQEIAALGNLRTAMEEAFFALQQAPSYLPLHTYMGELLLRQERQPEAIAKFTVVARAYSVRSEAAQAAELYQRVIQLSPTDLEARQQLIDQYIALEKIDAAIYSYFELADLHFNLADLEMARQTYMEALQLVQQAGADRTWGAKILYRMADIDLQSMDWRQALRVFEQIRTLDPEDEKARSNLIEINYRLGQEKQALSEVDNFIGYLIHTGQPDQRDKAIFFLENLVGEYSERVPFRQRLAELYRLVGRVKEAVKELDTIGELLLEQGDRLGAIRSVEAILALNPADRASYEQLLSQLKGDR